MKVAHNLTGNIYGRLKVIDRAPNRGSKVYWNCICKCGNLHVAATCHLKAGKIESCCNCNPEGKFPREYNVWKGMLGRCRNPNNPDYASYGGRGIKVCTRWTLDFFNFFEDVGIKPEELTFDRLDVDGNYEPGNWRWANAIEQANNKRYDARRLANQILQSLSDT